MNTQVQKIKDEIERRVNQFKHARQEAEYDANKLSLGARIAMCEELLVFINSLPEEPINDNLEKAAYQFACSLEDDKNIVTSEFIECFKAGAKWMKKQMMKDAIPAKVVNDEMSGCVVDCDNGCLVLPRHAYKMTDKLNIIIIKEDTK